jgi:flagellar biosynthesis/type III secretory pathway protein FliH
VTQRSDSPETGLPHLVDVPFLPVQVEVLLSGSAEALEQLLAQQRQELEEAFLQRARHWRESVTAEVSALRQSASALGQAARQLWDQSTRLWEQASELGLRLALAIAHRWLDYVLARDAAIWQQQIHRLVEELGMAVRGPITVKLHPADFRRLEGHLDTTAWTDLVGAEVALMEDPELPEGSCAVESDGEGRWWDPKGELNRLAEALWELLRSEAFTHEAGAGNAVSDDS